MGSCDCDFIFLSDASYLLQKLDDTKAVYCVNMITLQKKDIKWMEKNKRYIPEKIGLV